MSYVFSLSPFLSPTQMDHERMKKKKKKIYILDSRRYPETRRMRILYHPILEGGRGSPPTTLRGGKPHTVASRVGTYLPTLLYSICPFFAGKADPVAGAPSAVRYVCWLLFFGGGRGPIGCMAFGGSV